MKSQNNSVREMTWEMLLNRNKDNSKEIIAYDANMYNWKKKVQKLTDKFLNNEQENYKLKKML